jgi:putative SOS response-associated peptidase YedK
MCNLYTVRKSAAEVAADFGVSAPVTQFNVPEDVYPGYPGMVIREQDGERQLQSMVWGWPLRLKGMKPKSKPKPVNNIADLKKAMWVGFARKPQWCCIIPLTGFAEAEGAKGRKTRTWFSLHDRPIFAWAGLWRESAEWGPVYSGVMTDCNEAIRPVHDRMPVLLHADEYDLWLHGKFDDIASFQDRCLPDEMIAIEQTREPWTKQRSPKSEDYNCYSGALVCIRMGLPAGRLEKLWPLMGRFDSLRRRCGGGDDVRSAGFLRSFKPVRSAERGGRSAGAIGDCCGSRGFPETVDCGVAT